MKYHERRITFDEKTQNFKVTVPELGLEVLYDTEMGALLEMRKEVAEAAKRPQPLSVKSVIETVEQFKREYLPYTPEEQWAKASSADINDALRYLNGEFGKSIWGESPADAIWPEKYLKTRQKMRDYFKNRNEDG